MYPPVFEPNKLIHVMDSLDSQMAESLMPHLVGARPNTYTFTKSIAEALVASYGSRVNTAIVRPSIIGSTWKAPIPGWVDNLNGPAGICLAAGTGIMRVMPGKEEVLADIVPVDTVANFTIAVPWFTAKRAAVPRDQLQTRVFNMTSGSTNACKWEVWVKKIVESYQRFPLESKIVRRPHFYFADKHSWYYWFRRQLFHIFPAQAADILFRVQGKKPQMIKAVEKLDRVCAELGFFTTHGWKWENRNGQALQSSMNDVDRKEFDVDMSTLHWPSYVEGMCVGVKKFLLKEDMARVHVARRTQRRMMIFNFLFKLSVIGMIIQLLMPFLRRRGLVKTAWLLALPTLVLTRA